MIIYHNGTVHEIQSNPSLHEFLIANNYIDQHFAVALNNKLIPRTFYKNTILANNDRVDIIVPMQGG